MEIKNKNVILVVDDTEQNLSVLGNILTDSGYKVSLVTSGIEAFESIEAQMPDLILLDIMMPVMDGYEVCRRLKQDEKTKEIPIIFLTAKVETEDIVKGFQMGIVDYVTKPFRQEELLARVKTHLELRRSLKSEQELVRMKDRMFSIIGHDLRGPLGTFMMLIETLTDENSPLPEEKVKKYLQQTKDISKNAYNLLENLLTWARSQQKLVKFEPSLYTLKNIVDENIRVLEGIAKNKSISILNEIDESLSAYFDINSISTVIRNLISNSLKFTNNNGEVKVTFKKPEGFLQVSIIDAGVGMSPEKVEKLFRQDQIFSSRGTHGETGTGLGLLLCKDFVEGNGGKIWAESEIGKGTTFNFTLPLSA